MMQVPLFTRKKEVFWLVCFFIFALCLSLFHEYYKYQKLTTYSLHVNSAKVLNAYIKTSKKGKAYEVLKLQTKDVLFYTALWKVQNLSIGQRVQVGFFTKDISFYDYLKGFFAPLKFLKPLKKEFSSSFQNYFLNQHKSSEVKSLYGALFFAKPLPKEMQERVATWGLAHLVAISGFHLGLISAILFFLLKPLYTFFQDRFFPYRNATFDLSITVFVFLGAYAYYINLPPSVIRAFAMGAVGFLLFHRGFKVLSFNVLLFTVCSVVVIFPKLLFALGFWFSVSGVFYIYLYLHHFIGKSKLLLVLGLNIWVFVLMLPIVHSFFELFSWQQVFSPLISILFGVFYPLSLGLHVIGFGDTFDGFFQAFLGYPIEIYRLQTPSIFLGVYILLSLFAIRFRRVALFLPFVALSLFFI